MDTIIAEARKDDDKITLEDLEKQLKAEGHYEEIRCALKQNRR